MPNIIFNKYLNLALEIKKEIVHIQVQRGLLFKNNNYTILVYRSLLLFIPLLYQKVSYNTV